MNPTAESPNNAPWYTPSMVLRLAGGETLIKPGKPVQRANARLVAKWTGISTKTLERLSEAGFIRVCKPTPWLLFYYPAEVEEFIAATEADPDFWSRHKRHVYLNVRHKKKNP